MLLELRREHKRLQEAILILERLARTRGSRRGRPPIGFKEASGLKSDIGSPERKNGLYSSEPRPFGHPPGAISHHAQIIEGEVATRPMPDPG
jgi:hypothetical protein